MEWQATPDGKQPYYIDSDDGVLRLAAAWECWQDQFWSCSIITQPASKAFAPIHDRMPLSLNSDQMLQWLDHSQNPKTLVNSFKGLRQYLAVRKADHGVNSSKNKHPITFL